MENTLQCSHCDKTFYNDNDHIIHMRSHIGEEPFQCSHCDNTFYNDNDLKTHMSAQTGERTHQ